MSDYSSVAPPKNFSQSTAFAAALQRAKQIAAKINPTTGGPPPGTGDAGRPKRPLEDGSEPEAKKLAGLDYNSPNSGGLSAAAAQAAAVAARVAQNLGGLGSSGPMGGTCNEDIRVPDKMVGLIIGRGGEQITRLQAECGCKIQMAPDSGGLPERLCSLSGPRDAVARAREMILNIVNQRGRSEGLGDSMSQNGPSLGQSGPTSVEIMIPGPKVGLIIGKGGETIKQLQEKSGAKMVVIQDGPNPEQEKPLRITGDPQKVEYAKQLVYDLIAEKEMQAFNRGGRMGDGPGRGPQDGRGMGQDFGGPGGGDWVEVFVPKIAVGVVIGKGGDMIKKIQMETGCRLQFQQSRDEGPGDRLCYLQGKPQQVQQAKDMIEDLIDSVRRDPSERGRNRNGNRQSNGGSQDGFSSWGNGSQSNRVEVTFIVPSMKCGVIIGRGGETIKQINAQSGAHCVLDRNAPSNNPNEKMFIIRGEHDQVENAKRIISETVQMPLNFQVVSGGSGQPGNPAGNMGPMGHTGYPGMGNPQGYPGAGGQGWGYNPQGWGAPEQAQHNPAAAAGQVQINPVTGQPDYSQQWIEYYRSMGMHREASMIEQQSKGKAGGDPGASGQNGTGAPNPNQPVQQAAQQAVAAAVPQMAAAAAQPDYSAQWAEYYRSIGNIKEAEAIEANMKQNKSAQPATAVSAAGSVGFPSAVASAAGGAPGQPGPPGAYGQAGQAGQAGFAMSAASYMQQAGGLPRSNPSNPGNGQFQGYPGGYGGYPSQNSN